MAYMDSLQSGIGHLASASAAGRRGLGQMIEPLNQSISSLKDVAGELELLPGVPAGVTSGLRRGMRALTAAQGRVAAVVDRYERAVRVASGVEQKLTELLSQEGLVVAAVGRLVGRPNLALSDITPTGAMSGLAEIAPQIAAPYPHLMVLQPLNPASPAFYFGIDTAAFDELRRRSDYRWAAQERLGRRPAQQGTGLGDERLTLKGAVFPHWRGGTRQLDAMRAIGARQEPFVLTTGYGEVLGTWCLVSVDEAQSALLAGGIPRKQEFTLEMTRYGDDLQNL